MVLLLVFVDELIEVDCLVGDVSRALLVMLQTQGKSTSVHLHGTETEAEDVKLACLTGALSITLTIDQLFVVTALGHHVESRPHTCALVVDHALRANWGAHIALSDQEAGWTLWIPLVFTLLAIVALLGLSAAPPER